MYFVELRSETNKPVTTGLPRSAAAAFLICLILVVIASRSLAEMDDAFSCKDIPGRSVSICALVTPASHGPFDDVVMYLKAEDEQLHFLRSHTGLVAIFGEIGVSAAGTYVWTTWAEEGHPMINIYRTEQFLKPYMEPESVSDLYDYDIDHFDVVREDGVAVVGRSADDGVGCIAESEIPHDPDGLCHEAVRTRSD